MSAALDWPGGSGGGALKVLMLLTDSYGVGGGIATYNRDLIAAIALAEQVKSVTVVSLNRAAVPSNVPAKVVLVGAGRGGRIAWVAASLSQIGKQFDAVICGHVHLLKAAVALNIVWRAPLVMLAYGVEVWPEYGSSSVRRLLRRVRAVWSISRVTRDRLVMWSGFDPAWVEILPNAIHLEDYADRRPNPAVAARHGLAGRRVLLTVARLERWERYKGIDRVIAVLPALRRSEPSLVYLVVGGGQDRAYLEAEAARHGVSEQVIFTGHVDDATKIELYHAADAFVMPGTGEGFGFVYLEAMASGLPTIGSVMDGSRDALRDGMLGQLVDPGSPEQIEAAVLAALEAPRRVPSGLEYFAWPNFVTRVADALAVVSDRRNG